MPRLPKPPDPLTDPVLQMAGPILASMRQRKAAPVTASDDYEAWLGEHFPEHVSIALAPHHHDLWRWVAGVGTAALSQSYVAIWPRGHGKSTTAELATVYLASRRTRRYGLYVSGTQDQANEHVQSIRAMFEAPAFGRNYATVSERRMTRAGQSRGWTQSRLRTADGFGVDAVGLDKSIRGVRDEERRPDFIVLDDIDDHDDSPLLTAKKIARITRGILPTGVPGDTYVLAVQNLVHPDGVFARLASATPPFIAERILSGPIVAVRDAVVVAGELVAGEPTWPARGLDASRKDIATWGLDAWLEEAQHDVGRSLREGLVLGADREDGVLIFSPERNVRPAPVPLKDTKWRVAGIDPGGDGGDATAIGLLGVSREERQHIYRSMKLRGQNDAMTWHQVLSDWAKDAPIHAVVVGETGGSSNVNLLRRMGWNAYKAEMSRAHISHLQGMLKVGRLTIDPSCAQGFVFEAASWWWAKEAEPGKKASPWATTTGTGHHADEWDMARYMAVTVIMGLPAATPGNSVVQVGRNASIVRIGR